ncbi:DUF3307 domain-containing protein [Actinokineospora enzanensis]|uniref:DUF3307 domain-containing protein n=1 Tax=Actinokineospora enzanensis TaxID=155975 RepID=UPI00036E8188|nr:DUF3307 domain-containing protein [Actinokineospora enzanensis]
MTGTVVGPSAVTFAVLLPALLVAHQVGDHWAQTDHQAVAKGRRDRSGRMACVGHVASYTVVTAGTVAVLWWLLGLPVTPVGFVAGQAISAVTHYWADRRFTLSWLARVAGKGAFARLGGPLGGGYILDQSWHQLWLLVAALVTAVA